MAVGSQAKARIMVVDDHPMIRSGLVKPMSCQPDLVCCGEAATVAEAEAVLACQRPDLLILDL